MDLAEFLSVDPPAEEASHDNEEVAPSPQQQPRCGDSSSGERDGHAPHHVVVFSTMRQELRDLRTELWEGIRKEIGALRQQLLLEMQGTTATMSTVAAECKAYADTLLMLGTGRPVKLEPAMLQQLKEAKRATAAATGPAAGGRHGTAAALETLKELASSGLLQGRVQSLEREVQDLRLQIRPQGGSPQATGPAVEGAAADATAATPVLSAAGARPAAGYGVSGEAKEEDLASTESSSVYGSAVIKGEPSPVLQARLVALPSGQATAPQPQPRPTLLPQKRGSTSREPSADGGGGGGSSGLVAQALAAMGPVRQQSYVLRQPSQDSHNLRSSLRSPVGTVPSSVGSGASSVSLPCMKQNGSLQPARSPQCQTRKSGSVVVLLQQPPQQQHSQPPSPQLQQRHCHSLLTFRQISAPRGRLSGSPQWVSACPL